METCTFLILFCFFFFVLFCFFYDFYRLSLCLMADNFAKNGGNFAIECSQIFGLCINWNFTLFTLIQVAGLHRVKYAHVGFHH